MIARIASRRAFTMSGRFVGVSRFGERALFRTMFLFRGRGERHRTLLVGAGRAGRSMLRELNETPGFHHYPSRDGFRDLAGAIVDHLMTRS